MSDIPDPNFMDDVVIYEDVAILPLSEPKISLKDAMTAKNVFSRNKAISRPSVAPFHLNTRHPEGNLSLSLAQNNGLDNTASAGVEQILRQLRIKMAEVIVRKIREIEESLAQHRLLLDSYSIRSLLRYLSVSMTTSLSDQKTYSLKSLEITVMSAADRISVRPLLYRADYDLMSRDPPFTREGLPRAISMPSGVDAISDIAAISEMCMEHPSKTTDRSDGCSQSVEEQEVV